jgi:hypothetical protein
MVYLKINKIKINKNKINKKYQDNFQHPIYHNNQNLPQIQNQNQNQILEMQMQQQIPQQNIYPNFNLNPQPNQQQPICPNLAASQNRQFNQSNNQPNILPLTRTVNQNQNNLTSFVNNNNQEEDNDGKHICYIITLSIFFGFFAGFYFYFRFRNIRRKELAVGVYLAICFISSITHLIIMMNFDKLFKDFI